MKYLYLIAIAFLFGCSSSTTPSEEANDTTYLESGVKYVFLQEGGGDQVEAGKRVTTHINLIVGSDTVWSTYAAGEEPFVFVAKKDPLIQGFDEVLMHTRNGDRILAVIPPELGYGASGSGPIPPNATLQFDIEILNVEKGKLYVSDTLYSTLTAGGIDAMTRRYEEIKDDTAVYRLEDGQWRILSHRLRDEERYQEVIDVWTYRFVEVDDVGGHYQVAKAYEGLGDIANAIIHVEKAIALDSLNNPSLQSYLEDLKQQ